MIQNGRLNQEKFTYIDSNNEKKTLWLDDIYWAFQSEGKVTGKDENKPHPGNIHTLFLVGKNRNVFHFNLPEADIETFFDALKEANPAANLRAGRSWKIDTQRIYNCRDMSGLVNKEGKILLCNRLIRSSMLFGSTSHDRDLLKWQYHLKTVIDLRTDLERLANPDPVMIGIRSVHAPVFHEEEMNLDKYGITITDIEKAYFDTNSLLMELYPKFMLEKTGIRAWRKVFDVLLEQKNGTVLFHCTQGKDRTGMCAALILYALDFDEELILEDYERSSIYLQAQMNDKFLEIEKRTGKTREQLEPMAGRYEARKEFFEAAINAVKEKYGTVDKYLEEEIGLTQEKKKQLKAMYLV